MAVGTWPVSATTEAILMQYANNYYTGGSNRTYYISYHTICHLLDNTTQIMST